MATGIIVVGLAELRRELRRVGDQMPGELARLNKGAGQIVAAEAQRRAPRGPHQGGGRVVPIAASIKALQQQRRGAVAIGGARTPHAEPTEFGGTLRRYHSKARTTVQQRAFLYPAISATTEQVITFYENGVGQLMARAFG